MRCLLLGTALLLIACAETPSSRGPSYDERGPHAVGHRTIDVGDTTARRLTVEIWYPTSATEAGSQVELFAPEPAQQATYRGLLDTAPSGCPTLQTRATRDAPLLEGLRPLLLFSHCHECTRFSSFSLAEHLASHGFVVAAPDHAGNTLFDLLEGEPSWALNADNLEIRAADIRAVLDALLQDPTWSIDTERIGVWGHSFGSVTAGRVAQLDPRVRAAAGIAAPMENPLIPGVALAEIDLPLFFVVAVEDNSITEFGNIILRQNFDTANTPAWKLEVQDAGHWSFSDIAGLTEDVMPGCGDDARGSPAGGTFTYLDPELARNLLAGRLTAFFALYLNGDEGALETLETPDPSELTSMESRP